MGELWSEIRLSVRRLFRAPGFAAIAILTLALGIGANSAMFSIVNAVLLEPLPYRDPGRLVRISGQMGGFGKGNVNPVDALDYRAELSSFESLALFHGGEVVLVRDGVALRVPNARITHDYFDVLGVQPLLGRAFGAETETPGNDREVILSYALWQSAFAGARDVLERTVLIGENEYRIVGVMPEGYRDPIASFAGEPTLWRPMAIDRERQGRGGHFMQVFARLGPDVSLTAAQSELDTFTRRLEELYPNSNANVAAVIDPLRETIVGDSRGVLSLLMAAVGVVLLIGSVNVANLLLARGASRSRELAICASLGASRFALVRMLLMEALILATAGGLLALVTCRALIDWIGAKANENLLVRNPIELDASVLAFTIVVSIAAALVCGVLPAIQASGTRAFTSLRETGRVGGVGRRGRLAMKGLVVTQIALSVVVLVAAGLLVRSLERLTAVDSGVDPRGVVVMDLDLSDASYPEPAQVFAFQDELQRLLASRPGITGAGFTNIVPFDVAYTCDGYLIEGEENVPGSGPCAETRIVSSSYLATMRIPVVSGRALDRTDVNASAPGIVVSEAMARRFDGDPVGQRVRISIDGEPWATVVGVVGDVRHFGLGNEAPATIYVPFELNPRTDMKLAVRSSDDIAKTIALMRAEVGELDSTIPVNKVESLAGLLDSTLGATKLRTALLSGFGLLALILAASGIYGVFSFQVASGRRDTGVRIALGADRPRILAGVLRDVVVLALVGVAIGVAASFGAGRVLETFLYGVTNGDAPTIVTVAGLLFAVALGACWIPAQRASRIEPVAALKEE